MNAAAFASYLFLSAFTPGPNNIMAMNNSIKRGFRGALPFCLGMLLGFGITMTVCAVFTSALYRYVPALEPVLKWIGAGYILILAAVIYRDKSHSENKKRGLRSESLATGVIMQFVNVKGILYGITALSVFVLPFYRSAPAMVAAVAALTVTGFAGTCCWAAFGSLFQRFFENHRKLLNGFMALLLVVCAVVSVV